MIKDHSVADSTSRAGMQEQFDGEGNLQNPSKSSFKALPAEEVDALKAFYVATNGASWIKPWNLNAPPSTWHGVVVHGNHIV
jgi:hypothetical protein